MNKEKFTELTYLYLLDEIGESGKIELEDALMQNDRLKEEFELIKQTVFAVKANKPSPADERLLASSRISLMRAIRKEAALPSPFVRAVNSIRRFLFENYKLAFGGVMTFVLGIVIGYLFLFPHPAAPVKQNQLHALFDNAETKDEPKISNVEIAVSPAKDGQVEVRYDEVKPVTVKGETTDPFIQQLLVASMLSGANPGIRLRSVNTISRQLKDETQKPDPQIKQALITAMKTDINPAVRKEALGALTKYQIDYEIRNALLYVLSNDRNSGMRVAAINALADLKQSGKILDEAVKDVLTKKAATDNNNFIRLRAASILQEIN